MPDELRLLCERHHTKVHHGFRVERDTVVRWHSYHPDATEILLGEALLSLGTSTSQPMRA